MSCPRRARVKDWKRHWAYQIIITDEFYERSARVASHTWNLNYLLDTSSFLWFVYDDKRLSAAAVELLEDSSNAIYLNLAMGICGYIAYQS